MNTLQFLAGNFFDSISRFAVPFFVMLSGYFMLDEKKELPVSKIKYKILKLIFLTAVWSAFYALCFESVKHFFSKFVYGYYHLWYMYMLIGLYLITPVLRLFVKEINKSYIYYIICLGIIFKFVPGILDLFFAHDNEVTRFAKLFQLGIISVYLVYYLIGWTLRFVDFKLIKSYLKHIILLCITSLSVIIYGTLFVHCVNNKPYKIFYASGNLPVLIYSVSLLLIIFYFCSKFKNNISDKIRLIITKLSSMTFGVFLVHAALLNLWTSLLKNNIQNPIFKILLLFILTIISSFLVIYVLSKIKYLKELIKI